MRILMVTMAATILLIPALGCALPSGRPLRLEATPAAATTPDLRRLAWLAGSWSSAQGGRVTEEHWTTPDDRLMLGMSRSSRNGRAESFEFLRIVARRDSILYVALPGGRGETEFALAELSDERVVFENPSHDFPRRIVYARRGRDVLVARVEGTREGRPAAEEWTWRRAPIR